MPTFPAILCGGLLLAWPAIINRYPLLFSDTGGLLEMGLVPAMGWDKPWVYGPLLAAFHWQMTLWLPLAAQCVLVSSMLWLAGAVLGPPSRARHVLLCAILAVATTAPWFTTLLMPDVFTAVTVLSIFVLCYGQPRLQPWQLWATYLVATLAIAAHLSHLVLAAALVAASGLLLRRWPWRPALPLAAALGVLLATNLAGNRMLAISPNGSIFALARLIGDGPARDYIDNACPAAGYSICRWKDRLPADSDDFLWRPDMPLWSDDLPLPAFAAESAAIVRATIAAYPTAVATAMAVNTAHQLVRVELGDTLVRDHLDAAVLPKLQAYFPPAELRRYAASLQVRGGLRDLAAPFRILHLAVLGGSLAATIVLATRHRRDPVLAGFATLVLVALLANAFATGALSHVHDRYQARLAWIAAVPPLWWVLRYAARFATSSGDMRTSAS